MSGCKCSWESERCALRQLRGWPFEIEELPSSASGEIQYFHLFGVRQGCRVRE